MSLTFIILCLSIILVIAATVFGVISRYKRCASDELLIVFGRNKKIKVDGKEVVLPSKIIHGGGTFVWPIIQDWKKMSLAPLQIKVPVDGIDSQAIPMHIPVVLTTAISRDTVIQQNAATRFLSAKPEMIVSQLREILIGEVRAIMATMPIENINADRTAFLFKCRESLEQELAKVGFDVTNINISEVTDDKNYIKNMGEKAATKAQAQAEADIAEQKKEGDIRKATTEKEKQIAVANAQKEQAVTVAKTEQEREVNVANVNRDKEIQLATAEKERESGIAQQIAEKVAVVAAAQADAESSKASSDARRAANVAKSNAEAESAQKEAEAAKNIRIAQAMQKQETETKQAENEREAKVAEYEAQKRTRTAEAEKLAGVAEQKATIEVSKAKAEAAKAAAEAVRVKGEADVDAEMRIAKTRQERQLEVNEAQAKANEAELNAKQIIPAKKAKEQTIIEAEALKEKAILEAEAEKQRILKEAEAEAEAIRIKNNAEAEGRLKLLTAEAEGKKQSLLAEAEALQQKELAPAMAFERMIEAAGDPLMAVQWKLADHYEGIAGAQAAALSSMNLGNVTIYGSENTGAKFAQSFIENLAPALSMINGGVKDQFKQLFGSTVNPAQTLKSPEEKK